MKCFCLDTGFAKYGVKKSRCFRDVFGLQAELRILTNCGMLVKVRPDWVQAVALVSRASTATLIF